MFPPLDLLYLIDSTFFSQTNPPEKVFDFMICWKKNKSGVDTCLSAQHLKKKRRVTGGEVGEEEKVGTQCGVV